MKLIKSLVCVFSLAITAILLAGCSAKADKLNEVAKEAMKAQDEAEGIKLTIKNEYDAKTDGVKERYKSVVKISSNSDEEMIYSIKVSGVSDNKKFNIKESGAVIKDNNNYKVYVNHKSTNDGNKEEYKNVYTTYTSSEYSNYVSKYLSISLMTSGTFDYILIGCESITQEQLGKEENGTTIKASSFLGNYKVTMTTDESEEFEVEKFLLKATVKFDKNGIKSAKIIAETKDGDDKCDEKVSVSCKIKDVKIKAPKGIFTEK